MLRLIGLMRRWSFCLAILPIGTVVVATELTGLEFGQYYEVWGVLQERVYRTQIRDVDHLKQRLIEEWSHFDRPDNH